MNWLLVVFFLVALYALIAGYIKYNNLWEKYITFYGPILAIKTENVAFFDRVIPYSLFFRIYGTLGVVIVIVISVLMSLMLVFSLWRTVIITPEPIGIYAPQNLLAIPGVNEFIPFSFAVWFAFVFTLVIHEFGHAVLCRVEGIRIRSMGVLLAIIPIGAFVEPEEEDVLESKGMPKIRMFGAGITNNILVGLLCFILMFSLLGLAVPTSTPLIKGIYQDYPADIAGVPPFSVIKEVNGVDIVSRDDVTTILESTRPGDEINLVISSETGEQGRYSLTLAEWPNDSAIRAVPDSGFMGIYYYDAFAVKNLFDRIVSPAGLLLMIYVPIDTVMNNEQLMMGILAFDSPAAVVWDVPFPLFWVVIQTLFWCGWFNLAVGTFNALPFIPLDGGYIMQEGVTRFFERRNRPELAKYVVAAVSWLMLFIVIALIALPYMMHILF
ncbi:MAG: site-2 protease family protein [Euryarchaeota archaeon]|nr:site-2 protease family protein [Euryarchaeota archaeon]